MKHLSYTIIFLFVGIFYSSSQDLDCYTIVVGKKVSKTGTVLVGHNEDDWGNKVVNLFKVKASKNTGTREIQLHSGKTIKQEGATNSYILIETTTEEFGDVYLNENGVFICSNACPSKEDKATGILGYELRKLIAEKAKSAKDGVKIAGELINKYGYSSSGRTYCIADTSEAWLLAVVKGKHWIAQRIPDNKVAIVPNYYTIDSINLADTTNFLGSKDIIKYAIKRKWYNPKTESYFSFRKAYSSTSSLYSIGNIPRHWAGINLLSKKKYPYNTELPFAFIPEKKVSRLDIHKVLAYHYEWTDFETNYKIHKNPHSNIINRICNAGTKFSVIAELQSNKPIDYGCILWFHPMNPCIHPGVPIYFGIKKFPHEYQTAPYKIAIKQHFDKGKNTFEHNPSHAYYIFNQLTNIVNVDYQKNIISIRKFKDNFEGKIEKEIDKTPMQELPNLSYKYLQELYEKEKEIFSK
jgi:dipeptidase